MPASHLIPLVYAAVEDSTQWSTFLQGLIEALNCTQSIFLVALDPYPGLNITASVGVSPATFQILAGPEYRDPWMTHIDITQQPRNTVVPSHTLRTDAELETDEWYQRVCLPAGYHYGGGILFDLAPPEYAVLTVNRPRERGPLTSTEVETWQSLVPHLSRAVRITGKLARFAAERDATLAHLDGVGYGLLLVTPTGVLVCANQLAQRFLDESLAITVAGSPNRIQAVHPDSGVALSRALLQSGRAQYEPALTAPTQIQLSLADGTTGLLAIVAPPTSAAATRVTTASPTAAIYLIAPAADLQFDPAPLVILYNFTNSEARLTCLLAAGNSLADAAKLLHVSVNTVRTHLQRALAKAGCHRQAELVIQVLKTCRRV